MNPDLVLPLCLLGGYVIGATPFGFLAGRLKGVDIREHGSGNIGATNVLRTLGKRVGIPVFILDVLKGLAPVLVVKVLVADAGLPPMVAALAPLATAIATILGHSFTFWLGFKGGKGVATSAGALLPLFPLAIAFAILVWLVIFKTTRYVALASIAAGFAIPVGVLVTGFVVGEMPWPELGLAGLIAFLVLFRHRSNLARLRAGTEHRFTRRSQTNATSL